MLLMLLQGSRLSVLVVKDVAAPSPIELRWCKGSRRWALSVLFRSLVCHVMQAEWSWPCPLSTLSSSHAVANVGRKLVSCQLNSPWGCLACAGSLSEHPSRDHILVPQSLLQLPCSMPRKGCLSTDLSPIHCTWQWACDMLRKSMKRWRGHDCKQLLLPEPSCSSAKAVYHALPYWQPWKGCKGLGRVHMAREGA